MYCTRNLKLKLVLLEWLVMMSRSPVLHLLFLYLPLIFQALPSQRDTFFEIRRWNMFFWQTSLIIDGMFWPHMKSQGREKLFIYTNYVKGLWVFLLLFTKFPPPPPKIINKHFTWSCSPSIGNNLRKANLICSQNLRRCLCEFFCQNLLFLNQLSLARLVSNSNISLQATSIAVFIFCNSADFLLLFSCS